MDRDFIRHGLIQVSFFPTMISKAEETDPHFSVAECYVTIIVSCAPAMSSFWANIFTKSAFYSNFRSSFLFSPSTRLASTKNASPTDLQRQLPYPGSPSHLVHDSNGYYELHDGAYSKPQADISSSGERSSGEMGIITKSTTIDQLWERKGQR